MSQSTDTTATEKAVRFALKFGEHIHTDLEDKKISILEGAGLVKDMVANIGVLKDLGKVPAELANLSGVGTARLLEIAREEIPELSDAHQLKRIESAQRFLPHLIQFVQEQRGLEVADSTPVAPATAA